jgi:hypothetical protein
LKSNLRKIQVENQQFRWLVKPVSVEMVLIRIWIEGKKSAPWIEVNFSFHNLWYFYGEIITHQGAQEDLLKHFQLEPVKPKIVAEIIAQAKSRYQIEEAFKTRFFELDKNGKLVEFQKSVLIPAN